jgi:hypothetical protein
VRRMIKPIVVGATALLMLGTMFVCYISPLDLGGKERVVAHQQLPNGDKIQVVQYWNNGDFYNLDMRHVTSSGAQYECVIDPDCLRVAKCRIDVDARRGVAKIVASHNIEARYQFNLRRLTRKNGVQVEAEAQQ